MSLQDPSSGSGFAESLATVYYSILALDTPIKPQKISVRILILSVCITGGFLFASYSAGLVSYLTVDKFDFPIKSFEVRSMNVNVLQPKIVIYYVSDQET